MNIETNRLENGWKATDKDTDLDVWGKTEKAAVYSLFRVDKYLREPEDPSQYIPLDK